VKLMSEPPCWRVGERGRRDSGVDWAKPGHAKELGCRKKEEREGGTAGWA
jgi:hypothetical protein